MCRDGLSRWSVPAVWLAVLAVQGYLFGGDGAKMFIATLCFMADALLLLAMLSIPRRVEITSDRLVILCLLEMTIVGSEEIESVELLSAPPRRAFPVAGVWGFGGYYGYWFDLRRWSLFKIYTADRHGSCLRICRKEACDIVVAAPREPIETNVKQTI